MAVVARDTLLENLQRSGLLDEERLSEFLANQDAEADGEVLLEKLLEAELLTPWQADSLRAGKWRGFFVGKYRLLNALGHGAMGSVFLAEHRVMRHRVALKVLSPRLLSTPNIVNRFEREARAAALIQHPNVVRAFDVDCEDNVHFLVMEYVQGEDLAKIVDRDGPLDPRVAAQYIQQVARGLHEAHSKGLIHRDIKPANLLRDSSGLVKILDLGLARVDDESAASVTLMSDAKVLGTVDYLAPEQAINSHNIDNRADQYSLGCTLYFLLTGVPPFPTGSITERMMKHQTRRPVDLRKRRPGAPDVLVKICNKLMEKQPAKRFATAGEAADALGDFLEGRTPSTWSGGGGDELTFAEDADPSLTTNRTVGSSSTASGGMKSAQTTPDNPPLIPEPSASKSLLEKASPLVVPLPELTGADELKLEPLGPSGSASPLDQLTPITGPSASLSGSGLTPIVGYAPDPLDVLTPLDALPPLDGPALSAGLGSQLTPVSDPFAASLPASGVPSAPGVAPPPLPVQASAPQTHEKHYPLWALLGIGLLLGLVLVGIGYLVVSAMK